MKNTLETRLGIFFALCFIVGVIILEMIGVGEYFKPGYKIYANFHSIQELKKGDPVRMAGVEIGKVAEIDLTNDLVRITMKIKSKTATIRTDSKASIRFTGLMGQNFVSIDFGSPNSPKALVGAELTTSEQGDLNSLLAKLQTVADEVQIMRKDLSTENLSGLLGPLTHMIEQNSNHITTILGNVRKVSDEMSAGRGTMGRLLFDETLYNSALTTVAGVQSGIAEFKSLATDARSMMADVNSGKGNIGMLLKDDTLYRDLTNTAASVRSIVQKVDQGQGTVGKLINDESFYKNVKVSLQKLDKATESLEDQGPLSVLGIAVGSLF